MVLYIYSLTGSPDITLLNVAWGYKDIPDPGGCADMTGEAISQDAPGDGNVEWHQGLGGPKCPQGDCHCVRGTSSELSYNVSGY